ncbi:MAG: PfkB family carbohydrate kinase [Bacteroidales bacterium]|nr:PfkB family carbohydrate kinase [Bacteroidales bacterium]
MANFQEIQGAKRVLLVNDMCGYGKVALAAMIPIVTHAGHVTYNMPTCVVSNNLELGKFSLLDTTDHIRRTIAVYDELGFRFDAISTGFIVNQTQAKMISEYCQRKAEEGAMIFVDPIMGDEGRLYNGVEEPTIVCMRELVRIADVIVPNYTEAAYLTGMPYKENITTSEAHELIDALRKIGSKSVIVTSAMVNGNTEVIGYDVKENEYFTLPYSVVPVRLPGTGDMFSAVLVSEVLNGKSLRNATQRAMDVVRNLVIKYKDTPEKCYGIPIEECLDMI